mmetsp:Transcript_1918/g.3399  ORF Transcript_1918/g.3399 Transcript_1918/m.3399 type:complete len:227 (+) Transcript_1918:26-706(+)
MAGVLQPKSSCTGNVCLGSTPPHPLYNKSLPMGIPIPLHPKSPRPRMRSPSVTTMTRISSCGQFASVSKILPLRSYEMYMPLLYWKILPQCKHASPTTGVYITGMHSTIWPMINLKKSCWFRFRSDCRNMNLSKSVGCLRSKSSARWSCTSSGTCRGGNRPTSPSASRSSGRNPVPLLVSAKRKTPNPRTWLRSLNDDIFSLLSCFGVCCCCCYFSIPLDVVPALQ